MTKTLKEIVYSILESIYEYRITDDHDITDDWLKKKIADVNIRLIEEVYKNKGTLDSLYQKSCCIEVECERVSCTIDGESVPSGDVLWYADIQSLNTKIGWRNIAYLGLSDMSNGFRRVSFSGFTHAGSLDWVKGTIYTVVGNKVYFKDLPTTGAKMLCMLSINANPIDVCDYDEDLAYPTPDAYKLELMVKQDILSSFQIALKDESQDSRDNTKSVQGNPQQQIPE